MSYRVVKAWVACADTFFEDKSFHGEAANSAGNAPTGSASAPVAECVPTLQDPEFGIAESLHKTCYNVFIAGFMVFQYISTIFQTAGRQ
jgi:hypothetical protein